MKKIKKLLQPMIVTISVVTLLVSSLIYLEHRWQLVHNNYEGKIVDTATTLINDIWRCLND